MSAGKLFGKLLRTFHHKASSTFDAFYDINDGQIKAGPSDVATEETCRPMDADCMWLGVKRY